MALTSTLYTGLSGLDVNQTQLNVVGNNIANANTTAFKSSRALFKPQFYVTNDPGTPADGVYGGSNPSQVGLGASVAAVQKDFTAGSIQPTGKQTDMAIDGSGFFVVQGQKGQSFTRDGSFSLNDQKQLVDAGGNYVMGYGVDSNFQVVAGNLTKIKIPLGADTIAKATGNASLIGNLNSGGAAATGASVLGTQALQGAGGTPVTTATPLTSLQNFGGTTNLFAAGQTITATPVKGNGSLPAKTFTVTPTSTVADLQTFFQDATGIDTAPPAGSPGPTPGVSLANVASGGQQLVITGNVGTENVLSLSGAAVSSSSGANPFTFTDTGGATGESTHTVINAFDSLGAPVAVAVTAVLTGKSSAGSTWDFFASSPDNQGASPVLSSGTLSFDTTGKLTASTGDTIALNRSGTAAAPSQSIKLDFSGVQSLADASSTLVSPSQDGFKIGTLNNFAVGSDGVITGTFTNGLTRSIGQVATATFDNPQGLVDKGSNNYQTGPDSGQPVIAAPTSMGTGAIRAGALESSNVDLSKEFINMIVASTGFSASSRVISTSNQLLTELLNSQR